MKVKVYVFNTSVITRAITEKIADTDDFDKDRVILTNPSTEAKFPCCVVNPPLQKELYKGAARNLSVTIEVWGNGQIEVLNLFDNVSRNLAELNFKLTNNTPLHRDEITRKWRFGGYFDCRWNAITNSFERN